MRNEYGNFTLTDQMVSQQTDPLVGRMLEDIYGLQKRVSRVMKSSHIAGNHDKLRSRFERILMHDV